MGHPILYIQADFRPDVTQLAADSAEPEGRHVKEDDVQRKIEMERLEQKRAARLERFCIGTCFCIGTMLVECLLLVSSFRIEAKRQAQRRAFESEEQTVEQDPFANKVVIDSRPVAVNRRRLTAYDFIDQEKEKRDGEEMSDEDEWWDFMI